MARIGINALYMIPGSVGGTEIYLRELLAALAEIDTANEYFVFTNLETSSELIPKQANFTWKPQALHAHKRPARILWEQTVLPWEVSRHQVDVLLSPGFTAPLPGSCRYVTVFHDLQHLRYPEYFRWYDLPAWRCLLWASAHRSSKIIAVSEATRSDLLHYYRLPEDRIRVIYHGVDRALFRLRREHIEPFVLCVSTLHPHKNLERLIRTYGRQPRDYRLVLAGMRGFHTDAVERLIHEMGLDGHVTLTGWISREELFSLYDRALACIQPSIFEGFGMPVLEAMAAGVPLACSNIPPHREIVGDTVLTFDPLDEEAIADALEQIVNDELVTLHYTVAARERAHEFTWERTARQTLEVLLAS
jgi:glycosyltransferase involved in cell wall biosynthesis